MKKLIASVIFAAGTYALAGSASAAECGDISIAEMNWASAGVAAQVDKIILENGYGCKVSLVTGDTQPTFTSMNERDSRISPRNSGSTPFGPRSTRPPPKVA